MFICNPFHRCSITSYFCALLQGTGLQSTHQRPHLHLHQATYTRTPYVWFQDDVLRNVKKVIVVITSLLLLYQLVSLFISDTLKAY